MKTVYFGYEECRFLHPSKYFSFLFLLKMIPASVIFFIHTGQFLTFSPIHQHLPINI